MHVQIHDLINCLNIFAARKYCLLLSKKLWMVVGGKYWQTLIVGVRRGSWEASPVPSVTEREI